jgi:Fe-coproporphyrin III synthase
MINITELYCGVSPSNDPFEAGQTTRSPGTSAPQKPFVIWNITRRCNLRCVQCYSDSGAREYPGELSFEECRAVVDDLAQYDIPGLHISGGEPLMHPRFYEIAACAREKNLSVTLRTNGTLIDLEAARNIKSLGIAYVGISLDGIGDNHDRCRGRSGLFKKAVSAIRNCKEMDQKVGLRLTLSRNNITDLDRILDFIEKEEIDRVCWYQLSLSGRGTSLVDVPQTLRRAAMDRILERAAHWAASGRPREILAVDQPVDGVYLYLQLKKRDPERAEQVLELLRAKAKAGIVLEIANIDSQGGVHPDRFWPALTLGNVRETPFSGIWSNKDHPTLNALRAGRQRLEGRCQLCKFADVCGGGFRMRALQVYQNLWAPDPSCYLTSEEVLQE